MKYQEQVAMLMQKPEIWTLSDDGAKMYAKAPLADGDHFTLAVEYRGHGQPVLVWMRLDFKAEITQVHYADREMARYESLWLADFAHDLRMVLLEAAIGRHFGAGLDALARGEGK